MNRIKNGIILLILISFLCFVAIMPVTCIFKTVTGIYCPACGLTRSFLSIINFHFIDAIWYNILGIPMFAFIITFILMLIYDFLKNRFYFIPKLLNFFEKHYIFILVLLLISFVFNNLKFIFNFI